MRDKIYTVFDGDTDIHYFYLMKAWTNNENFNFEIKDAHDLNYAKDTSLEESIKAHSLARASRSCPHRTLININF